MSTVCTFQHSQNWPGFQECKMCCNRPLLCSRKTANFFVPGFQRMFYLPCSRCFFSHVFFRNTYFAAVSVIKRSFSIIPFRLLFFFVCFLFGYGKVASFLFDWIQQQKHSTERTKKMSAGMVSMSRISEKSSR